jgi:hypothetical protein
MALGRIRIDGRDGTDAHVCDWCRSRLAWYHSKNYKVQHMGTVSEKVLEETKLFRAALPGLLEEHRGQWVVFKGGSVRSFHGDETSAYQAAVQEFGAGTGYVIAPVSETHPTPVTAAVLFGLTCA